MAIVVEHQPSYAAVGRASNLAGYGQYELAERDRRDRLRELETRRQQEYQQQQQEMQFRQQQQNQQLAYRAYEQQQERQYDAQRQQADYGMRQWEMQQQQDFMLNRQQREADLAARGFEQRFTVEQQAKKAQLDNALQYINSRRDWTDAQRQHATDQVMFQQHGIKDSGEWFSPEQDIRKEVTQRIVKMDDGRTFIMQPNGNIDESKFDIQAQAAKFKELEKQQQLKFRTEDQNIQLNQKFAEIRTISATRFSDDYNTWARGRTQWISDAMSLAAKAVPINDKTGVQDPAAVRDAQLAAKTEAEQSYPVPAPIKENYDALAERQIADIMDMTEFNAPAPETQLPVLPDLRRQTIQGPSLQPAPPQPPQTQPPLAPQAMAQPAKPVAPIVQMTVPFTPLANFDLAKISEMEQSAQMQANKAGVRYVPGEFTRNLVAKSKRIEAILAKSNPTLDELREAQEAASQLFMYR